MIENLFLIIAVIGLGIWAIIKLKNNFSQDLFFKIGMYAFLIQGLANMWGLGLNWPILPLWSKISRLASILFIFAISYFFKWMLENQNNTDLGIKLSEDEIDKFLADGKA